MGNAKSTQGFVRRDRIIRGEAWAYLDSGNVYDCG